MVGLSGGIAGDQVYVSWLILLPLRPSLQPARRSPAPRAPCPSSSGRAPRHHVQIASSVSTKLGVRSIGAGIVQKPEEARHGNVAGGTIGQDKQENASRKSATLVADDRDGAAGKGEAGEGMMAGGWLSLWLWAVARRQAERHGSVTSTLLELIEDLEGSGFSASRSGGRLGEGRSGWRASRAWRWTWAHHPQRASS